MRRCGALAGAVLGLGAMAALAADAPPGLQSCRLKAVEHDAWCGSVRRPLDPSRAQGVAIDVRFAVLPAVARNKKPDPVFFFAGGPGQSAIELAGQIAGLLGRFSNRRDIVLIDQRGTGRSAPLVCRDDSSLRPLREQVDPAVEVAELGACRERLMALPYGDLRQFTTTIAMQDADAVRRALGARRVDLVGVSYGTRAALEYMRQFPAAVRRVVIDGVAPPDMALPATFAPDAQQSFDALLSACAADVACRTRYPALRAQWHSLLASLPREITVAHPVTQATEHLTLTRAMLASLVRQPLYAPALASALPFAVSEAAQGRYAALFGLAAGMAARASLDLAEGMHFSVVCAEDMPRVDAVAAAASTAAGGDFGAGFADLYRRTCADWPRGNVPAAFYRVPPAPVATLLLSGANDPATPPRHAARVAQALGPLARHVIVPNAGHGVSALGCMRDVVFRFIDAETDADALRVDAACADGLPRPPAFVPVTPASAASAAR